MKKFAVFCLVLGLLCAAAVGGYILTSKPAAVYSVVYAPADDALYAEAQNLSELKLQEKSKYRVCSITLDLTFYSPFKAEWMTFTPVLEEGDVLIEGTGFGPGDVDAFGKKTITATILTRSDALRSARLEYYLFGRYHSIVFTEDLSAPESAQ